MIRRLLGMFLLVSFLCAQTELYQVLKTPVLVIHFLEHKAQKSSFSFRDFMVMHYFSKTIKDHDYEKDMQLPFKSHNHDKLISISSALIPERSVIQVGFRIVDKQETTFHPGPWLFCPISSIWQPPKSSC